jgi:acyl-coenzyme A thioesterase PaaI-like protein
MTYVTRYSSPDTAKIVTAAITTPPGFDRLAQVPLPMAIGMSVSACDEDIAHGALPLAPPAALPDGTLDPLALLPFLDQLSSFPVSATAGMRTAMSTIDLAVDFLAPRLAGPVTGTAQAIPGTGRARMVTGVVHDAEGTILATSRAWFSIGAPPGGGGSEPPAVAHPIIAAGSFRETLGLMPDGDDAARLAPDIWAAVGWAGLPALHGGAIAATLGMAALHRIATLGRADLRLATLSVRFLRAARPDGAIARAVVDGIGRRTARLSIALDNGGTTAATAQALFVVD